MPPAPRLSTCALLPHISRPISSATSCLRRHSFLPSNKSLHCATSKASQFRNESVYVRAWSGARPSRIAAQHQYRQQKGSFALRIVSGRGFSTTPVVEHGHISTPKKGEERKITFVDKDGEEYTFEVADGDNLLDIAQANDLEMEGACGGSCACSTCHVIVEDGDMYDAMPEPDDDENDMLDLAFGLTETSRLGCQVKMSPELDGLRVRLPSMTRNMQASDFQGR